MIDSIVGRKMYVPTKYDPVQKAAVHHRRFVILERSLDFRRLWGW
jgi:hypothetical protein